MTLEMTLEEIKKQRKRGWKFVDSRDHDWLIQRVEELEADNAKLREALKPFVELYEVELWEKELTFGGQSFYDVFTDADKLKLKIPVGVLRKASEALNG